VSDTQDQPVENHPAPNPGHISAAREVFWHNVIIEMLTALAAQGYVRAAAGENAPPPEGFFSVLTRSGQRIPIAMIQPLLACSIANNRSLSGEVQCSVFRLTTPAGEVLTLPVSEITGVHALSREVLEKLQQRAAGGPGADNGEPFGFAAFTSLARQERELEELPEGSESSEPPSA